jgi:hypothetical protein
MITNYAVEFGVFAVVLILCARRDSAEPELLSRPRRMLWTMLAISLVTVSVLRSDTSGVNDFGFRGVLVVQFALLVMAAPLIHDLFTQQTQRISWARMALLFTLIFGAAGTAYELTEYRVYAPLVDAGLKGRDESWLGARGLGERTYWIRQGFQQLNHMLPGNAVVQYDPVREEVKLANLYSERQAAMGERNCSTGYGGDVQACRDAYPAFFSTYNGVLAMRTRSIDTFCDQYHINVLVADDIDPVWKDPGSWVWTRPALVANQYLRAVPCGHASNR